MMRVSCGWRSAMRREHRHPARRKEHDRELRPSRPPARTSRRSRPISQANRACVVERHAHAEHPRLLLPFRQQRRRLRILERDAAHDGEAVGIALGRLQRIVVAVARPGRRHDDGAVDAGFVHHRHELLDGERLRKLGLGAGHPGPVRRFRLPQMDLRIDDRSLRAGWSAAGASLASPAPRLRQGCS